MTALLASGSVLPSGAELETLLELGEGGMAKAYLARAVSAGGFQRLVVLKRLNLDLLGSPAALERFLAEARVAARLHHANIVGTQLVGRDAAGPFIVLDYIEGGTLEDLVVEEDLPIPVLLRIALDTLAGLQAAHAARDTDGRPLEILHRDISLQNVLVSMRDGVARLSDFGVAKSALGTVRTEQGMFVGKLSYFSPEYLRREPVGPSLDVYALGVTLWIALARQEPWPDADEAQVIHAILEEGIPPIERHVEVAPEIAALVMRACDRDPRQRFQTAREMAEVVERFERECGWLASHAEVATLVEERLGAALERRRELVASLTHSSEISLGQPVERASSPPVPESVRTRRVGLSTTFPATRGARAAESSRRDRSRVTRVASDASRKRIVLGGVLAVAVALAVVARWSSSSRGSSATSPATEAKANATARPSERARESTPPAPVAAPSSMFASPGDTAEERKADAAVPAKPHEPSARVPVRPVRVRAEAASELRKKNPYRPAGAGD